jgi:molecular chaperone Hsp33
MEKKKIYGDTLKERLKASARDRIHRFILADGTVRGAILHGTRMVNEMRANHELGILETLVLGRAYLGIGLMSANLKGENQVSLKIRCQGPIKGLSVEGNAFGEVRGYLSRVPIPIEKPLKNFDLAPFFGEGVLSVTRQYKDAKQPFTGEVSLEYGNIALDLANYYLKSEQIPTAFNLSIKFDREGVVTGAGGVFLQAMPDAGDAVLTHLENLVAAMPSMGEAFEAGTEPKAVIESVFAEHGPRFLGDHRVEFMCHCNRTRLATMLSMLPEDDLSDISKNGPFPLEIRCHYCNTTYPFNQEEIVKIYGQRVSNN